MNVRRAALELEDLTCGFGSGCVLNGITIRISQGESVAILGRNGAGKTTLLRSVMGLHPSKAGRIFLFDREITVLAPSKRAQLGLGYVPQGRAIFPYLTVEENLAVARAAVRGRDHATPTEHLLGFIFDLFPVLWTLRKRKGGVLSGGEQQQLALARALLTEPRVLLLDEPTEGIQPSVVESIGIALKRIVAELKLTILLVEQFLDFAWAVSERYYVLQRGYIVAEGSVKSSSPGSLEHLLSV